MRTRKLGPLEVSVVGLGCNNFGGRVDEDGTRAVVDAALDAGVTFFDTADIYGNRGGSETLLGKALEGRRDEVVLATKFGALLEHAAERHGTREFVRAALDASLRRLRMDHVDLYQHHQEDKETPLEEVMNAEMISYPNTKLMCSVNVDGAAAAVLASEKKARELGLKRAVKIRASVLTSDPWQERDLVMPDVNTCTRLAAKQAYEMAGVGPQDINLVELHDCFATAEILHYENLGLCKDGEAGKMIDSGAVALGGKIPVNVSGGLLSKGHPLGATGIANIYEVSTDLRGEADKRQVKGARFGLTHVIGLGSACAIHILEKPA